MSEYFSSRRAKWKEIIEKWQASGKVAFTWCRENNVNQPEFQVF